MMARVTARGEEKEEHRYYHPGDLMRIRPSDTDYWGSVLVFTDGTE